MRGSVTGCLREFVAPWADLFEEVRTWEPFGVRLIRAGVSVDVCADWHDHCMDVSASRPAPGESDEEWRGVYAAVYRPRCILEYFLEDAYPPERARAAERRLRRIIRPDRCEAVLSVLESVRPELDDFIRLVPDAVWVPFSPESRTAMRAVLPPSALTGARV